MWPTTCGTNSLTVREGHLQWDMVVKITTVCYLMIILPWHSLPVMDTPILFPTGCLGKAGERQSRPGALCVRGLVHWEAVPGSMKLGLVKCALDYNTCSCYQWCLHTPRRKERKNVRGGNEIKASFDEFEREIIGKCLTHMCIHILIHISTQELWLSNM